MVHAKVRDEPVSLPALNEPELPPAMTERKAHRAPSRRGRQVDVHRESFILRHLNPKRWNVGKTFAHAARLLARFPWGA